jgi:hypothetical protein
MARRIRGLQPRRNHFATLQPGIDLAAARFWQTVGPEKHAARRQFALHAEFCEAQVLIESLSGFRPEFSCTNRRGRNHQANHYCPLQAN